MKLVNKVALGVGGLIIVAAFARGTVEREETERASDIYERKYRPLRAKSPPPAPPPDPIIHCTYCEDYDKVTKAIFGYTAEGEDSPKRETRAACRAHKRDLEEDWLWDAEEYLRPTPIERVR